MIRRLILLCLVMLAVVSGLTMPPAEAARDTQTYTVQPGDTLWKISLRYQIGLSEIIAANPELSNPDLIYPGDQINIPLLTGIKQMEYQVIQLVNQERTQRGLQPLKPNWELSRVARFKSQDMRDMHYFSHTSPVYGSPFTMIRNFGLSFRSAGENIAAGQATPQQVMNGWMNSPGHRQNILNPSFTEIGVGYASGGGYGHYWTQMFISR
ncbi:MAG: SafA/ExsA family spore coat assembly protein [Bacillaceae bacterium]|nr:SafA/ExsA family spore coat assembly protein [Bacillaceae bacterium]